MSTWLWYTMILGGRRTWMITVSHHMPHTGASITLHGFRNIACMSWQRRQRRDFERFWWNCGNGKTSGLSKERSVRIMYTCICQCYRSILLRLLWRYSRGRAQSRWEMSILNEGSDTGRCIYGHGDTFSVGWASTASWFGIMRKSRQTNTFEGNN